MTPHEFITKWQNSKLKERAAAHEHFIDLCRMLGEKTPAAVDASGQDYAFEVGATKSTGGRGFADVFKRGHFGWEYKGTHANLDTAFAQLQRYAVALDNPPLLIVSDIGTTIRVHTNWTNSVSKTYVIPIADLGDAEKRGWLKAAFADPDALKPKKTRQELTEEVAGDFAELARLLRLRGHPAEEVAHFVNKLVFCMFAEDVRLLPDAMFTRMLDRAIEDPAEFEDFARTLFAAMKTGGRVGFERVAWFNGGLFNDDRVFALTKNEIRIVRKAAGHYWGDVDPSILGTLFERGLDPDKRSQLGAHYTDREKIMMIVRPVVVEPLAAEWEAAKAEIAALMEKAREFEEIAKTRGGRSASALIGQATTARKDAQGVLDRHLKRLADFRVLDPACGSGNFLYIALREMKDLELRAQVEAEALGLPRGFPSLGPEVVKGIELNPYAAELARVSVWIGEIQWMLRNGFPAPSNPVLKPLETIECRDALVTASHSENDAEAIWTEAEWPQADVIIGNPPFLGDRRMITELGEAYVGKVRQLYGDRIPGRSDLVCYWFAKCADAIKLGSTQRVGLVATNSVSGGNNLPAMTYVTDRAEIFDAWRDEPWVVEGAAVRVAIIAFGRPPAPSLRLDGTPVSSIGPDLRAGAALTLAARLSENRGVAFIGTQKNGPFDITGPEAREMIVSGFNPNGRSNADVVKPWTNGSGIVRRDEDRWIIDFGTRMPLVDAALYELPFKHVEEKVRPTRTELRRNWHRENWWLHGDPRPAMRAKLAVLSRQILTSRVSKHRLFVWRSAYILPDSAVVTIARGDDTTFGILHSRFHEIWSLRMGTWLGVGNDPRYTPTTTFETYPFPKGLTPNIAASDYSDDPRALAIAVAAARLNELRENWLNPPTLVGRKPEVVPYLPERVLPVSLDAEKVLRKRTLTNLYNERPAWLANAHRALDAAVAEAYGWPVDLSDDDVLTRLFALNQERARAQGREPLAGTEVMLEEVD